MHHAIQSAELSLRHRLGIPDDAERVLIFTESSHWDPDWIYTSEEYFERFVRSNLDQALEELQREPRRVYSIECVFFLRMYWDRCPEQRERVRALINEGRLRVTSSGVTTADTLLPSAEALLRDLLIGQEWLRAHGMKQEPRLAYFADSFGCSPALPSLLNAAGFDRTAITRIDGTYFMGCDFESSKHFPRPGSSAERLLNREHSLDFVWKDRNGAQVLCHWNAFTYGQGDMLAYAGLARLYLINFAFPVRTDRHVARRIGQYVSQLAPYSRTPYMLCPIGFDFVEPIPDLLALLDRYNERHYPTTGVWVVNAGLDDYLDLVEFYRDELPVLELDPNPYWTGFYTARPVLKQQCRDLTDDLLLAEKLSFLSEDGEDVSEELASPWWYAAVSNHHDFITGTSSDRVVEEEQMPWIAEASTSVQTTLDRLASALSPTSEESTASASPMTWSREGSLVRIQTPHYVVTLDEAVGGAIVDLRTSDGQTSLLAGPSNDLVSYRDSGGLWRMGLEFVGGTWREVMRASREVVPLQVHEHRGGLEIISQVTLNGESIERRVWFSNDTPVIHFRAMGRAAEGYSITTQFITTVSSAKLVMDAPGGVVTRPSKRIYDPTFWPLHHFVHLQDPDSGRGLAVLQPMPGAISYQEDGHLELVALRNATREKAFGLLNIPCNPASGHERTPYVFEYALVFTAEGDWQSNEVPILAREMQSPWGDVERAALRALAESVVTTDTRDVWVVAVKPADRGEGVIVRLYTPVPTPSAVAVTSCSFAVGRAFLCDARERDLEPLEVRDGVVRVIMPGSIATIRLLPS